MSSPLDKDDDKKERGKGKPLVPIKEKMLKQSSIASFFKTKDIIKSDLNLTKAGTSLVDKRGSTISKNFLTENNNKRYNKNVNEEYDQRYQEKRKTSIIDSSSCEKVLSSEFQCQGISKVKDIPIDPLTFKTLCFYNVAKTKIDEFFYCKLNHEKREQFPLSVKLPWNKQFTLMQNHLKSVHQIFINELLSSEFYCQNKAIVIQFDAIPSNTLSLFQKNQMTPKKLNFKPANLRKTQHRKATNKESSASLHLPIANDNKHFSTNEAPSTIVELTMVSMYHSSLIDFAHNESDLRKQLKENTHIRNELNRLKLVTKTDSNSKSFETYHSNYLIFSKLDSSSIYSLEDCTPYTGYSKDFQNRKIVHTNSAHDIIRCEKSDTQSVHRFMAACAKNGKDVFIEQFRDKMTKAQALLTEYAMIAFICVSPINENQNHGSTTEFKDEIQKIQKQDGEFVTKEDIVKFGCAEFVCFYNKIKYDIDDLNPVLSKLSTTDLKNLSIDNEFISTATEKAITLEIPQFLLTDSNRSLPAAHNYAFHLFISLFDTRAKIMKWYLMREGSYDRLKTLSTIDQCEFFDSINSVLADRPSTFADCAKWAINLFNRIFITNVKEANVALEQMGREDQRFPFKTIDNSIVRKFILAASLLLAKMYNLKGEDGNEPSENEMFRLIKETSQSFSISQNFEIKGFKKLEKFIDMIHLEHSITENGVFIQHPDDLFDMVIHPIAPFIDNPLVEQFIDSAIRLRYFNLNDNWSTFKNLSLYLVSLNKLEFNFPYFRWPHNFIKLV